MHSFAEITGAWPKFGKFQKKKDGKRSVVIIYKVAKLFVLCFRNFIEVEYDMAYCQVGCDMNSRIVGCFCIDRLKIYVWMNEYCVLICIFIKACLDKDYPVFLQNHVSSSSSYKIIYDFLSLSAITEVLLLLRS